MTKETDLIKMANGKKDLPVGISRHGKNKKGYRLHRSVAGKMYGFSSFQSLEHALRVNECIDVIVEDLRKAQENSIAVTTEDIHKLIMEYSILNSTEITRVINESKFQLNRRLKFLETQNARLHDRLDAELNKTLWQRLTGKRL